MHEEITLNATCLLQECIALVGQMNCRELHAIINDLFVQKCILGEVAPAIEEHTQVSYQLISDFICFHITN